MRKLVCFSFLALAGCGDADFASEKVPAGSGAHTTATHETFESQLSAPAPDYGAMLSASEPVQPELSVRTASEPPPADAKEVGETWLARLRARNFATAWERNGEGHDAPIEAFSLRISEQAFETWITENRWIAPDHISFRFTAELDIPRVGNGARDAIRTWPASKERTGAQQQAAQTARIFLQDGCFHVEQRDGPPHLAWFHAETGLGRDSEGYLIMVNRLTGATVARVGEIMTWAGPNRYRKDDPRFSELREVCGDAPIFGVGNPQSHVRFELIRQIINDGRSVRR
ncbi:hypothetical protein [Erythrobacter sp.]|uniref:hypothetical protein n=1 Tax=Erythrobacter sp. TaxID=1042 RepID=UPI0025EE2053|nr:hypothetical protein [Erythrobacter sp.]